MGFRDLFYPFPDAHPVCPVRPGLEARKASEASFVLPCLWPRPEEGVLGHPSGRPACLREKHGRGWAVGADRVPKLKGPPTPGSVTIRR